MAKLLAIAFHESVSVGRLEQLFKSEQNALFAATTAAHCKACGRQFALFFPQSDDYENMKYLTEIENRIAKDRRDGEHSAEINLTSG